MKKVICNCLICHQEIVKNIFIVFTDSYVLIKYVFTLDVIDVIGIDTRA